MQLSPQQQQVIYYLLTSAEDGKLLNKGIEGRKTKGGSYLVSNFEAGEHH